MRHTRKSYYQNLKEILPAGCGTMGAFFKTEYHTCTEEDCEDEGACKWKGGKCMENGAAEIFFNWGVALVFYTILALHV